MGQNLISRLARNSRHMVFIFCESTFNTSAHGKGNTARHKKNVPTALTPGPSVDDFALTGSPNQNIPRPSQSRSENQSPNRAHQADGDTSAKKRKIDHATSLESTPCSGAESITGPEDSIHHARNAKSIIQNLLSGSENIGRERQTILRTAMSHVDKMAKGVDSDLDKDLPSQTTGIDDLEIAPPDAPPPELLYMLLQGIEL
ncbi:hypothetical protein EYZ11_006308 [Aspergillus tanneri]|uniref:Uncharacterized protein n=1 Tax=Aspergillus tanneri TaxID=1220188 RepID=A0A4S3JFS3_9EURO|nr:hypothetical protein EYZ11_006308 [Aspergillus tanneri]